jgi:hypothetical protein
MPLIRYGTRRVDFTVEGTGDAPPTYQALTALRTDVAERTRSFVPEACKDDTYLANSVVRLLEKDSKNSSIYRLLPLPVLGAITGEPGPALPVCMLSRLWWTAADVFDDLNDGSFDVARFGLSPSAATIASVACGTLLPLALIMRQELPATTRLDWIGQFISSNFSAANGQFADVASGVDAGSLGQVMDSYAAKSGAACARDVAMTAQLAGSDVATTEAWREFGRLFGVLRQLANDRKSLVRDVRDDEDLANGTQTLLLAEALATVPGHRRQAIRELSERARRDLTARTALRGQLIDHEVSGPYDSRVDEICRRLRETLAELAAPSRYRAAVEWMIDVSGEASKIQPLLRV